jgi:Gluconate 2-dehydrogenase subunit 3
MPDTTHLRFLTAEEHATLSAVADRLIPPLDGHPGGAALGVADFVDRMLGAFTFDPPRIWAGGPFSGRNGGAASFEEFLPLSRVEEIAWRTRIEGSGGRTEREFNGPVVGWQERYRSGLAALGNDFCDVPPEEQSARLDTDRALKALLYEHACHAAYGDPVYGGNSTGRGWAAIEYPGDVQPRGYTDEEVSGRE